MRLEKFYREHKDDIVIPNNVLELARKRCRELDIYPVLTIQDLLASAYILGVIDMGKSLYDVETLNGLDGLDKQGESK